MWGISRPDLNPNGNYAYYVQEEPYNPADSDTPKVTDVMGWHNTNASALGYDTFANSHMVTVGGNLNLRNVYGGYSTHGDACNNVAIVNNGTISGNVTGGYAHNEATAKGNKVFIYGGNFTGVTDKLAVSGGQGKYATENMVTIYGGTFSYEINGGVIMKDGGRATHNTVVIAGNFSGTPGIYGGNVGDSSYAIDDIVSGNTLYLSGANTVSTVQNFETINITEAAWGTPVLTMSGSGLIANADGSWATINTGNINFSGKKTLAVGKKTILIKNSMDNYQGQLLSGRYTAGTSLRGTGTAEVEGDNLMYTIKTVELSEQTHNTVMGAEVGMAALSMGNDFIGAATEGLSLAANTGADGISSFGTVGGGAMKQETGSHVDVHTWNAILGIGHQNKKDRGTFEYGAFFEYGTGNYTTHAENGLRGDGSARYTGGGLLAKYRMKNNVYVEGSLRAGSIHDEARNVMSDGAGNPYSYDTDAPYFGFHIGVGKEFGLKNGDSVDVYGKYFFNRKNGVSFEAGGYYDLDAVTSSVLRVGARYTMKREKWNFYSGLAYEYELDGKAAGTANGAPIRAAETKGGSLRAELGAAVSPSNESPWSFELNVSGFAGKKQGITGGMRVVWMF